MGLGSARRTIIFLAMFTFAAPAPAGAGFAECAHTVLSWVGLREKPIKSRDGDTYYPMLSSETYDEEGRVFRVFYWRGGDRESDPEGVWMEYHVEGETTRLVEYRGRLRMTPQERLQPTGYFHLEFTFINGSFSSDLYTDDQHGDHSVILNAKEEFQKALALHRGEVRRIVGAWSYGTNYEKFMALIQGHSPPLTEIAKKAALLTWTGQRAVEAGFKNVEFSPETAEMLRTGVFSSQPNFTVYYTRP